MKIGDTITLKDGRKAKVLLVWADDIVQVITENTAGKTVIIRGKFSNLVEG